MEKYLEKIGIWLYGILPDVITRNDDVRLDLGTLKPTENITEITRDYYIKKLSLCAMVVVIGVVLSVALWIGNINNSKLVDNRLFRNEYGEGEASYTLKATDGKEEYDIKLNLQERIYTDTELDKMSGELLAYLDDVILGENESLDRIEYDLNLVSKVSGYPFSIRYTTDQEYISEKGSLVNRTLDEPVITEIGMKLSYDKYIVEHTVYARVYSKAVQPATNELLQEELDSKESENRENNYIELPDRIGDIGLKWSFKRSYTGLICIIITPILMAVMYVSKDKDLHKKVEEREMQMRLDYSDIVSALALLVGAGMTVPNAWKKIAYDYKKKKEEGSQLRFAYEEMLITVYEMDSGVMQSVAYERFGRRCRVPCYNKLATMVSQNIRKGASNLPSLLKEEAREAFEDQKHLARQQGERAGTRLLGPMMLLLVITMVIIMVPALTTYF